MQHFLLAIGGGESNIAHTNTSEDTKSNLMRPLVHKLYIYGMGVVPHNIIEIYMIV